MGSRGVKRKTVSSPTSTDTTDLSMDDNDANRVSTVSEGMRRMAARLAELGVDEEEIHRLATGGGRGGLASEQARPLRKYPALLPTRSKPLQYLSHPTLQDG